MQIEKRPKHVQGPVIAEIISLQIRSGPTAGNASLANRVILAPMLGALRRAVPPPRGRARRGTRETSMRRRLRHAPVKCSVTRVIEQNLAGRGTGATAHQPIPLLAPRRPRPQRLSRETPPAPWNPTTCCISLTISAPRCAMVAKSAGIISVRKRPARIPGRTFSYARHHCAARRT
jgi:hypothetical protein